MPNVLFLILLVEVFTLGYVRVRARAWNVEIHLLVEM